MRKMLITVVLVSVACMMQAVTLTWKSEGYPQYNQWSGQGVGLTSSTDFSFVMTYSRATTVKAWSTILSIGYRGQNTDLLRVQWGNATTPAFAVYGNLGVQGQQVAKEPLDFSAPAANVATRFIVTKKGDSVTLYIGGQQVLSFTAQSLYTGISDMDKLIFGFGATGYTGGAGSKAEGTYGPIGIYNGALTAEQVANLSNPKTSLEIAPEPTVLALLALGVAGLALRRCAA